jgi:hypothetical protein
VEAGGMEMKLNIAEPTLKNKIKLYWHCFAHNHQPERHYHYEFVERHILNRVPVTKEKYIDYIRCRTCAMKIDRCIKKMEGRTYDRYGHWDSTYE